MKKSSKRIINPDAAKAQRDAKIAEAAARLEDGLAEMRTSAGFIAYLQTLSKFHKYSFNNVILIHMQIKNPRQVAGYETWKKLGRQVRKGETGAKIYVPLKYAVKETDENGEEKTVGSSLRGFSLGTVFDISQTDGPDLPGLPISEIDEDDCQALVIELESVAASLGLPLEYTLDVPADVRGTYSPSEKRIKLRSGMSSRATAKTLIHELFHGLEDKDGTRAADYSVGELFAEGGAYTVMSALGFDTSEYSFGYLAHFGGDADAMRALADRIRNATHLVLDALEAASHGTSATIRAEAIAS